MSNSTSEQVVILEKHQIEQKVKRIAFQIFEEHFQESSIVLVGVSNNGFVLAQRIATILKAISPLQITVIEAILNKQKPWADAIQFSSSLSSIDQQNVVVVDDVLNSGKTLIYLIKALLEHPVKRLKTAVLVDRNHRRFPIAADFVGISLSTTLQEHIIVELGEKEFAYLS